MQPAWGDSVTLEEAALQLRAIPRADSAEFPKLRECVSVLQGESEQHNSVHFRSFPPSLSSIGNASPGPPRYKKRREDTREEKHRDTQRKPCEDRAETGLTLPHAQERLDHQKLKSQGRLVL